MVESATNTLSTAIFSVDKFSKDDKSILYYTGLESFGKFKLVLNVLREAAFHLRYMYGPIYQISVPDHFILVLMKLRQRTPNYELATLFSISEANVYNIFCTWVRFMALQFKELNDWPSQELVQYYIPFGFKAEYPTTRVIIDGTEMPIKKPKLPSAQLGKLQSEVLVTDDYV